MLESLAAPLRRPVMPPLPLARMPVRPTPGPMYGNTSTATTGLGRTGNEGEALAPLALCMAHMLDEIDYGMLLVDATGEVLYTNHAARRELDHDHPLQLSGKQLVTAVSGEAGLLQDALTAAHRGLRKLLTLGSGVQLVAISVVPLNEPGLPAGATLLVLGKRNVCEQLSVQGYARAVSLTPAETRVLEMLCAGVQPAEIATRQGVAVSTVRTQIGSIRAKTSAKSIRELVRQVAVLPPLVGALRGSAAALGGLRAPLDRLTPFSRPAALAA